MTCGTPWWHVAPYGVALPLSNTGRGGARGVAAGVCGLRAAMAKYAARGWSFANPSGGGSRDPGPPLQPAFIPGHGWARVDSGGAACAQYDFASPLLAAYAENAAHYGTAAVPATFDDARAAARTWRANSYFAIRSQHQQTTPEESSEESSESDAGGAGGTGALMDDSE